MSYIIIIVWFYSHHQSTCNNLKCTFNYYKVPPAMIMSPRSCEASMDRIYLFACDVFFSLCDNEVLVLIVIIGAF